MGGKDHLYILWTNGDPITAEKMAFEPNCKQVSKGFSRPLPLKRGPRFLTVVMLQIGRQGDPPNALHPLDTVSRDIKYRISSMAISGHAT
jgi:hypothetical protein